MTESVVAGNGDWTDRSVAIGRAERRNEREDLVVASFGNAQASIVLDLLELVELAWHDCYGEVAPPAGVVDDIVVCSKGSLGGLIRSARLALEDWRDLRFAADDIRAKRGS